MFNIFVNDLFGELENVNKSPVNLGDQENFSSLVYADDLVLMCTSIEGLQKNVRKAPSIYRGMTPKY